MLQSFVPLVLASEIPVSYVGVAVTAVAGPLLTAITVLWRFHVSQIDYERKTKAEAWDAVKEASASSEAVIALAKGLDGANSRIEAKLDRLLERRDGTR